MDSYNELFTEEVGTLGELSTTKSLNNIPSLPPVTQYKGYKVVSKEIASEPNEGEFIAPSFDEGATFGEYATTTKVNGVDSMFTPSIDPQPLYNDAFVETTPILESTNISPSIPNFETSSSLQNIENSTYQTNYDFSIPNQEIELDFPATSSPILDTDNLQRIPDYTPILDTNNLQSIPEYSPIIETEKLQSIDYTPIFETENIESIPDPIIETENWQTISEPIIETSNLQTFSSPTIESSNLQTFSSPIIETSNLQTIQSPIIEKTNLQTIPKVNTSTYQTTIPVKDLGINYGNPSTIISPAIDVYPVSTISNTTIQPMKMSSPKYSIVETPIVKSSIVSATNVMPTVKSILPPAQSTIVTNSSPITLSVLPPAQSTIVTKTLPSTQTILPSAQTPLLKTNISYISSPLYKTVSSVIPSAKPIYTNASFIPVQPTISLPTYTSKSVNSTLIPLNIISQPIYSTLTSTSVKPGPLYSTYTSPLATVKSKPSYSELTVPFIPLHHRNIYSTHKRRSLSAQLRPIYNSSTFTVPLQHKSLYSNLSKIPVTQQKIPIYSNYTTYSLPLINKPLYSSLSTIPVTQQQIPVYSSFSTYTVPRYHKHSYSNLSLPVVSSKPLYSSFTVNSSMATQTLSQIPMTSISYPLVSNLQLSINPPKIVPLTGMNIHPIYSSYTYGTKKGHLPIYNTLIQPKPNMIQPGQYMSRTYTARRF